MWSFCSWLVVLCLCTCSQSLSGLDPCHSLHQNSCTSPCEWSSLSLSCMSSSSSSSRSKKRKTKFPSSYPSNVDTNNGNDDGLEPRVMAPNLLLIIADDLRQTFIAPLSTTPNLAKLRSESVSFDSAHCNVPLCGPSRASFLTGKDALESGIYGNKMIRDQLGVRTLTMAEYFKTHSYRTYSLGKVNHASATNEINATFTTQSWTEIPLDRLERQDTGYRMLNCVPNDIDKKKKKWKYFNTPPKPYAKPFECDMNLPMDMFDDVVIANKAVEYFHLQNDSRPFFMAVGFYRPHIPLAVHSQFWALFETDLTKTKSNLVTIAPPRFSTGPEPESIMPSMFAIEPDSREGGIQYVYEEPLPTTSFVQAMRTGYAAAISQMDYALGVLLQGLDDSQQSGNTVVVFVGDNGFHVGESSLWYKQLLTDHSTRVPMIVRVPWLQQGGTVRNEFVELLDLYRTLAELADLPVTDKNVRGKSLVPLLLSSSNTNTTFAISVIHRCLDRQCGDGVFKQVGFSLRNAQWRYNVWMVAQENENPYPRGWNYTLDVAGEELYDHRNETEEDHFNLAVDPFLADIRFELFTLIQQRYDETTWLGPATEEEQSPSVAPLTATPSVAPFSMTTTPSQRVRTRRPSKKKKK